MASTRVAPYGTWVSPIHAQAVAAQSLSAGIEDIILDPVTSKVYYGQNRPAENGRSAVVDAATRQDLLDHTWDARTGVHEYGGAAAIVYDGVLYFSHIGDGRVYKCAKGSEPVAITPVAPAHRFADFAVYPGNPNFIVSILEDHTDPHPARIVTTLCVIDASKSTVHTLVEGADFYSCARFSPDGKFIAWQQWHHPDMPYQSAEIAMASCSPSSDKGIQLGTHVHVAGKPGAVAAQDPGWTSNNTLFFFSDVSGFQNPWKFTFDASNPSDTGKAAPILTQPLREEFGQPQWWLSRHGSGALSETHVAFLSFREGRSKLHVCDVEKGSITEIKTPYAHIQYMHGDAKGRVVMLGQPEDSGQVVAEMVFDKANDNFVLRPVPSTPADADASPSLSVYGDYISKGQYFSLTLPPDNRTCHVTYYPPKNPNYDGGLPGERPPVVVLVHGGPFFMEAASLDWTKQFFTSRGWAHIDVNYGGSTGFGREFRESLHAKWGVLDVEDAWGSVLKLEELGLVDSKRAVVHGGSAGGYCVLQIATSLPSSFAAGSPHYGISDMRKLDEILHKFEYYLCDRLMGGKYEECKDVWHARSPIYHADKIKMPLLFMQGGKDTVIPAEQMVEMVDTIKKAGGKVELVIFPNEGHGWREAKSVQTTLERELTFFNEVLGLENTY
ncbi:alpha/beta-hydrolase [Artomyces pyxidatus]|uniref:Alpha/beta-hydrolase n=1 Tax=Artomyces pyxidatus TaxID=48021 RepID=A0ACB8SW50_9AGAM|nr:alpha/beta-hydrolase [Artomyces pyxidatus]